MDNSNFDENFERYLKETEAQFLTETLFRILFFIGFIIGILGMALLFLNFLKLTPIGWRNFFLALITVGGFMILFGWMGQFVTQYIRVQPKKEENNDQA